MADYEVILKPSAARELRGLEPSVRRPVIQAVDALKQSPRPAGVRKLQNEEPLYRIRVGDYRIVYQIDDRAR